MLLVAFAASATALNCIECHETGVGNFCGKMGEDFKFKEAVMNNTECPKPGVGQEGLRPVCAKSITNYKSQGESLGEVASRYCDLVDYADTCWTTFGGTTSTVSCVCSDKDSCNAAMVSSVVSMATVFSSILVAMRLL